MPVKTLASVMEQVNSYRGQLVRCRTSKGRNRIEETEGILMDVYPKLFTLYDKAKGSTVSFNYAELLTQEVQLEVVC